MRRIRIAGFTSYIIFIGNFIFNNRIGVVHPDLIRLVLGRIQMKLAGSGDFGQKFIFKKFPGDQCHIIGRGIMIFIMQTVGIGKVGIHTS